MSIQTSVRRLVVAAVLLFAGGAVCTTAAAQQGPSKGKKSVEARLQRFADKEEIQDVLLEYGRSLDARDFAIYSSLFATDGEWAGGFGQPDAQLSPALELRHHREWRHGHGVVALGVRAAR